MDEDDLEPRAAQPAPKNLKTMSIEGLNEYIAELEAEIDRARAAIAVKEEAHGAAESYFREP